MLSNYIDILRIPGAWRFSLGGAIMRMPMSMFTIAIILTVKSTYDSYTLAGAVAGANVIALSIAAPFIARAVDQHGQSRVMIPVFIVTSVALAAFVVLTWVKAPVWAVFVVSAIQGASWGAPGALVRSRWAQVVANPGQLNTAYALEAAVDEVAYVLGPIIATLMGTLLFPSSGLILAILLIAFGAYGFFAEKLTEPAPIPRSENSAQASVITHPVVIVLALTYIGAGAMFGATDVSVVAFTEEQGLPAMGGVLLGIFAFGSLNAALIYGARTWAQPLWRLFAVGVVALALGTSTFLFATNVPILALAMLVTGLTIAPTMTNVNMLIARAVPSSQLTEGLTWMSTAMNIGVSVGSMFGGALVDFGGAHSGFNVVIASAGLMVMLMLVGLPTVRRGSKRDIVSVLDAE